MRIIPKVLHDDEATKVFTKKGLVAAEKVLNAKELKDADLSNYPYETLCKALYQKLLDFKLIEIQNLAKSEDYADKKYSLEDLLDQLTLIIKEVKEKEKD